MQLSPSTQHLTRQDAGLCCWWCRRLRSLGVLDIKDASCRQDSNGKVEWRCLGRQWNCSAVRPQKVQSTSRYPRTVRLRYSVVPLWKRKKVSAQAPRDRYTRFRSSARSAWRDPRSAPGYSIIVYVLLTLLRTEGMYNNEWRTWSLLPWP